MPTDIVNLVRNHAYEVHKGLFSVDETILTEAAEVLYNSCKQGKIFVAGNGGSAAIAEHLSCDVGKGCRNDKAFFHPRVISLASNLPLITAIANDIDYRDIFSYQLSSFLQHGDVDTFNSVLIVISSSGESPNILRVLDAAAECGMGTIALTAFKIDNSACRKATYPIHVDTFDYGVAEDCHQAIMHTFADYIRKETHEL